MAAMTMSSVLGSRAALTKPFSAKPSQRTRYIVRAQDPASPDQAAVDGDVISYAQNMPGVTAPFPNIFDPANLLGTTGASNTKIRELRRWREAELTHGRVAMLAALGFIVQEQLEDFPGPFPNVRGPAIYHFQQVEAEGAVFWLPLLLFIGVCESYRVGLGWAEPRSTNFYSLRDDYEPGNLGFDPFGLLPEDPKERKDMQSRELNNGRLAMIAIAAFVVQELVSGQEIFEHTAKRLGL
ncbi:g6590 [Coccomyxa viridis]|uniref:Chlorophyll a-b binding protein, chloroplastic n=1 Tax=Coccomyxa viridis TaxID=1274662 RepID=A0ABP1FY29_9CHLO